MLLWLVARPGTPPSVLLIVIDTLRADHLGCYGYARNTSPSIDALARRSLLFRNAASAAPWTTPAMGAILSGLHPGAFGLTSEPVVLAPDLPSLPKSLQALGYTTYGVVSHFYIGRKYGFDQGFESWNEDHAGGHTYVSSPGVTDEALEALRRARARRPFFLFVHYFDPHYDYLEHEHRFSADYEGDFRSHGDNMLELRRAALEGRFSERDVQHLNDLYDSEIRFTDDHVGRLLDWLERHDLYDETLIILTGDHGEAFLDRDDRWIGHTRTLFQELIHVPLLIKLPGSREAREIESQVSTVDLFPTVMDVVGAQPPFMPDLEERSLAGEPGERPAFAETQRWANLQMVARGRWKLIRDTKTGRSRLFDLRTDPRERTDLAQRMPSLVADLERQRERWDQRNQEQRRHRKAVEPQLTPEETLRLRGLGYVE
jgi:arylsulfatase